MIANESPGSWKTNEKIMGGSWGISRRTVSKHRSNPVSYHRTVAYLGFDFVEVVSGGEGGGYKIRDLINRQVPNIN